MTATLPYKPPAIPSERELRDAVEVRIGLIGDRHLRRMLRTFFETKLWSTAFFEERSHGTDHYWPGGTADFAVEVARIGGAASASIPGVDRDYVTAAAIFGATDGLLGQPWILYVIRTAERAGSIPDSVLVHLLDTLRGADLPEYVVLTHAQMMSQRLVSMRVSEAVEATVPEPAERVEASA